MAIAASVPILTGSAAPVVIPVQIAHMRKSDVPLVVLSAMLYGVLWFGAEIYGSYRYEPSGVQYIFLPCILAPVCFFVAAGLWVTAEQARAHGALRILPFVGCAVLAVPPMVMLLSDRNLEGGRIATIGIGVIHAILLVRHLVGRRRRAPAAEPIASESG